MSQSAGWYPDPDGTPRLRFWDGNQWANEWHTPSPVNVPPPQGASGVPAVTPKPPGIPNPSPAILAESGASSASQAGCPAAPPSASVEPEPNPAVRARRTNPAYWITIVGLLLVGLSVLVLNQMGPQALGAAGTPSALPPTTSTSLPPTPPTTLPPATKTSPVPTRTPTYPSGFTEFTPGIAWQWLPDSKTTCREGQVCWGIRVYSQHGCPILLSVELGISNSKTGANSQLAYASANAVPRGKIVVLTAGWYVFDTQTRWAHVTKITCI